MVEEHEPARISAPVDAVVSTIYEAARRGNLVVCAGAGLSRAMPADLPSGEALGELLDERLTNVVQDYESPPKPENLIEVADAGAAISGGEDALRAQVLKMAKFLAADPNFGHEAAARLLTEGGINCLLLWNWDDCVERVDLPGERLQVALTYEDVVDLDQPSVVKVHGCATRRQTLLVTSRHLGEDAPAWADQAFADRLSGKTVVFVGIGDVAAYAERRLREMHEALPELDVWIVSPGIVEKWPGSDWSEIFPDLDEERRVARSADDFFDQLGRLWTRETLDRVLATAGTAAREDVCGAAQRLVAAVDCVGAVRFIRWCRQAATATAVGQSVVHDRGVEDLLLGTAVLAEERSPGSEFRVRSQAALEMGDERYEVLVLTEQAGADVVRGAARRRAEELVNQGTIEGEAHFVFAGSVIGDLANERDAELDIAAGDADPDSIFDGQAGVRLTFCDASAALSRAA